MSPGPDGPPYQRIADAIRERIRSGELRPGDRVPSTRAIVREWGVAMVTAAKALGVLQNDGLVEARPGIGTVVLADEHMRQARRGGTRHQVLTRHRIVAVAIGIADSDGVEALSMRHLATELDVGPMTLYRYVQGKDELVNAMVREVLGSRPLPADRPVHWRTALELVSRLHWELYRAHHWLPGALSMTRPTLVPEAMEHTEYILRTLGGLGLPPDEMAREAMTLPAFVRGLALSEIAEAQAERESGLTNDQWWQAVHAEVERELGSGRFPYLRGMASDVVLDQDGLFEHGLARHLDGLAARLETVP